MKQFVLPFSPSADDDVMELHAEAQHYLIRVRRHRPGDVLTAMDPTGKRYQMEILQESPLQVRLQAESNASESQSLEAPSITLMAGITKGKKMDLTVRQAVEGGALHIVPLLSEHSQIRIKTSQDSESKTNRWQKIAIEALQQCGGSIPSQVKNPCSLSQALKQWKKRGPIFYFHEKAQEEEQKGLHQHLASPVRELAIIVGPEGGLSKREVSALDEEGGIPIHLGPRILRAETAALYGLAAVQTILREKSEWQPT